IFARVCTPFSLFLTTFCVNHSSYLCLFISLSFFFFLLRPLVRSSLFPYTTLFRSQLSIKHYLGYCFFCLILLFPVISIRPVHKSHTFFFSNFLCIVCISAIGCPKEFGAFIKCIFNKVI